ncbi:MAG: tetratricopeptide repeat protein [Gemmatimonadota bacterium]
MPDDVSASLLRQVEDLAAEARWPEVGELLESRPPEEVLAADGLAYLYGQALYHLGRASELREFAARYEESARRAASTGGVMRALNLAGVAAFELGATAEAESRFDALMELAAAEKSREMMAPAANNLGALANLKGRRMEALSYYNLAVALYEKLGDVRGLARVFQNQGMSFRDLDRLEDSIGAFQSASELARTFGFTSVVAMAVVGRGEVELRRGDSDLAWRLAEHGLELAREIGDPVSEGVALRVRGLATADRAPDDVQDARRDLTEAGRLAEEADHALLAAEVSRDLGRLLLRAGESEPAVPYLRDAVRRFEAIGAVAEVRALTEELDALTG